jgi:cytochrome c553
MRRPTTLASLTLLVAPCLAQDGGQLYTTYCSACHGSDGRGASEGQFPPLAGSPWLHGTPERAIKAILHGLQGPVEVDGTTYNLAMPPQGAVLSDDQLAAILSFVRSSWGNEAGRVEPSTVAKVRRETPRKEPWTAAELLKLHPLPKPRSALENVVSYTYHGSWDDLPDFSKLKPVNVEEEHDGLLSVADADRTDLFGLVWEGEFVAPREGTYTFLLDCDDAARLMFGGETVVEVRGTGAMGSRARQARVELSAARYPVRIEYFEFRGQQDLVLAWKGPGDTRWQPLSESRAGRRGQPGRPTIPIAPAAGRAAIYRNFIDGTTVRGIGIGFPGGLNLAYSADHLAPELVWTGEFIDAARHWTNRGQGAERPAGDNLIKLSKSPALAGEARFRGYELDAAGNPTFLATCDGRTLRDAFRGSERTLERTLRLEGPGEVLRVLIAEGLPLEAAGTGWLVAGVLELSASGAPLARSGDALYLTVSPSAPATLTYRWK